MIERKRTYDKDEMRTKLEMRTKWDRVPLDDKGDPAFESLAHARTVFNDDEINVLVNRALYSMKYQRETHAKRHAAIREAKQQPNVIPNEVEREMRRLRKQREKGDPQR